MRTTIKIRWLFVVFYVLVGCGTQSDDRSIILDNNLALRSIGSTPNNDGSFNNFNSDNSTPTPRAPPFSNRSTPAPFFIRSTTPTEAPISTENPTPIQNFTPSPTFIIKTTSTSTVTPNPTQTDTSTPTESSTPTHTITPSLTQTPTATPTLTINSTPTPAPINELTPVIRIVYLVPQDKEAKERYRNTLENAIKNLQIWFRNQMGNGRTFLLHDPIIETVHTPHESSWYNTHENTWDWEWWFYLNVVNDASQLTEFKYNDPYNIWLLYIDADLDCNGPNGNFQIGGGGTSGMAYLPGHDLRGLAGENNPICPQWTSERPPLDTNPPCRWVGGLGHELGHALGLDHPSEEDAEFNMSIMGWGYYYYPDAILKEEEKDKLNENPFFTQLKILEILPDCNNLQ